MDKKILQEWECIVEEIDKETVWLRLFDITNGNDDYIEQAEIPIEKFTKDTLKDLRDGSILSWYIYEDETFEFVPRTRVEYYTQEDIDEAMERAEELHDALNWNFEDDKAST